MNEKASVSKELNVKHTKVFDSLSPSLLFFFFFVSLNFVSKKQKFFLGCWLVDQRFSWFCFCFFFFFFSFLVIEELANLLLYGSGNNVRVG